MLSQPENQRAHPAVVRLTSKGTATSPASGVASTKAAIAGQDHALRSAHPAINSQANKKADGAKHSSEFGHAGLTLPRAADSAGLPFIQFFQLSVLDGVAKRFRRSAITLPGGHHNNRIMKNQCLQGLKS